MKSPNRSLVINPGSTSTKIAVFDNEQQVFEKTLRHSAEEMKMYPTILSQYEFRKEAILDTLKDENIPLETLTFIVGRGGFINPIESGTYELNNILVEDLEIGANEKRHASNLAGLIAFELAKIHNIRSFIVDPPCVDEMEPIAKVSGLKGIERKSMFHALNQKAVARKAALSKNLDYTKSNYIVAHIGGGISVGAHRKGKVVDVNNALDGDGPFSPERSGGIPNNELIDMCFSGAYTRADLMKTLVGNGGLVSYLDINDAREVEKRIDEGSAEAALIYEAMAYQVAKSIGASAAVLEGDVDAIIMTGGIAYSNRFVQMVRERTEFIADFLIYPGEDEMNALALGGLRVMKGLEEAKNYK